MDPRTTAPPVASAQVTVRTGSTRPSAAHPATASGSKAGTRSSGDTSGDVDATCTSNGREKGAPIVVTARRASAASRQAATVGMTTLPARGKSAAARTRRGATATTAAQTNAAAVTAAVIGVAALSSTGSRTP